MKAPTFGMSDEYPRDGRETIRDDYEAICPTSSVGQYKAAQQRVRERDGRLPVDFADYLRARIPSTRHLDELPNDTPIDRKGMSRGA